MKTLLAVIPADTKASLGLRQISRKRAVVNFLSILNSYDVYTKQEFIKKYPIDRNPSLEAVYNRGSSYIHVATFNLPEKNTAPGRISYNGTISSSFRKMMAKYGLKDSLYTKIYDGNGQDLVKVPDAAS